MEEYEDMLDKMVKSNRIVDGSSIPITFEEPEKTEEDKKKDYEDLKDTIQEANKEVMKPIRVIRPVGMKNIEVSTFSEKNKRSGFLGGLKNMFSSKGTSISPDISPISTPTTMSSNELEAKKKEKGGKYFKEPFVIESKGKSYDLTDETNKIGMINRLEDGDYITPEDAKKARRKIK